MSATPPTPDGGGHTDVNPPGGFYNPSNLEGGIAAVAAPPGPPPHLIYSEYGNCTSQEVNQFHTEAAVTASQSTGTLSGIPPEIRRQFVTTPVLSPPPPQSPWRLLANL